MKGDDAMLAQTVPHEQRHKSSAPDTSDPDIAASDSRVALEDSTSPVTPPVYSPHRQSYEMDDIDEDPTYNIEDSDTYKKEHVIYNEGIVMSSQNTDNFVVDDMAYTSPHVASYDNTEDCMSDFLVCIIYLMLCILQI